MATPRPFVSEATADRIKTLKGRGAATTQRLQDPAVTLTITRQGSVIASTITPIRIRLDNTQPQVEGFDQGATEVTIRGTAKCWQEDVTLVAEGDRFKWDGFNHQIKVMEPVRSGFRVIHFERMGGVA